MLWFWGLSRSPVLSVLFYFAGINLIKFNLKKKKHSTQRAGVTMKTRIPSYPGVLWGPWGFGANLGSTVRLSQRGREKRWGRGGERRGERERDFG